MLASRAGSVNEKPDFSSTCAIARKRVRAAAETLVPFRVPIRGVAGGVAARLRAANAVSLHARSGNASAPRA
jgi:hypothetical protein